MSISVRCTCGRQFRVKESLAGKRARCSFCKEELVIPNSSAEDVVQPEFVKVEVMDEKADPDSLPDPEDDSINSGKCFFCRVRRAEDTSLFKVAVRKLGFGPFPFMCINCGKEWIEPPKTNRRHFAKAETPVQRHVPTCPQCESNNTTPVALASLPVGKFFRNFKTHGVLEYGDGTLKAVSEGIIVMPRCGRCENVAFTEWLTIGVITFVGYLLSLWGLSFWFSGLSHADWRDPFKVYSASAMVAIVPAFLVAVIAIIVSSIMFGLVASDEFPPLKRLHRRGWKNA